MVHGCAQPALSHTLRDDFVDVRLNNGGAPAIDEVDFGLNGVDPNDFVPIISQASG
jgi:hypothetical protein